MTLVWNGEALKAKMRAAVIVAIDETMGMCVEESTRDHPEYPPASEPFFPWANRTKALTDSVRVLESAHPVSPWRVSGTWGADLDYSLFIEIGTSRQGPTATDRMIAADGDPNLIVPEIGPLMARRHAMVPASDRQYPQLALRIAEAFNA